jgi:hypothetical protein
MALEVTCNRCDEPRWTKSPTPYNCQRCREALAGGCAVDPRKSIARRAQGRSPEAMAAMRTKKIATRLGIRIPYDHSAPARPAHRRRRELEVPARPG